MAERCKSPVAMETRHSWRQLLEAGRCAAVDLAGAQRAHIPRQSKKAVRGANVPLGLDHVVGDCGGIVVVATIVSQCPKSKITRFGEGHRHTGRRLRFHAARLQQTKHK